MSYYDDDDDNAPWYFLPVTTILGLLIMLVLYIIGANLLNLLFPGTVSEFPLQFFY